MDRNFTAPKLQVLLYDILIYTLLNNWFNIDTSYSFDIDNITGIISSISMYLIFWFYGAPWGRLVVYILLHWIIFLFEPLHIAICHKIFIIIAVFNWRFGNFQLYGLEGNLKRFQFLNRHVLNTSSKLDFK